MRVRRQHARDDLDAMAFAGRYHRHILEIFRPYLGRHVVEVGAGGGTVTKLLAALGPRQITAVEPSTARYRVLEREAKRIVGARVETVRGSLADAAAQLSAPADCFLYLNVLEHIEDDRAELAVVHRAMAPGAHLCVFVPALPALWSGFDRALHHVRRYDKAGLIETCRASGFTVERVRYFDWLGVLPWWLRFTVAGSTSLTPRWVRAYDAVGVPIIRATEAVVAPPFGKNLVLVGRKAGGQSNAC